MKKQKVCIIGGGLTGLITAITLSKLNLNIDLITNNISHNLKSNRTTAISQNNIEFLKKLKILNFSEKEFWPCEKMKLYSEDQNGNFLKIFEFDEIQKRKKIFYMIKNSNILSTLVKRVKKMNHISLKINKKISEISSSGILKTVKLNKKTSLDYNLIIICTGSKSQLVKNFFEEKPLERSYNEISITSILRHEKLKNNVTRQIFMNEGILAFLPISNTSTSIVWSTKKDFIFSKKNKNQFIKNKIKFFAKSFYDQIKFDNNLEIRDLNFLLRKKYYKDRTLLFGDALHVVHPLAGQGFNMILRDLESLEKTLKNKISLGLDIGSSDILNEFSSEAKPRNFVYSMGIDLLKNYFSLEKGITKNIGNQIIKKLNKNNFAKNTLFNIADRGLKF